MSREEGASEVLNARLGDIRNVFKEIEDAKATNDRLRWLEGQLRNIELQLVHMLIQLESGCLIEELGLGMENQFMDTMNELATEISQLKSLIQVYRSCER